MAMTPTQFTLESSHYGQRVDVVLATFTQLSRNQVRKLIADRAVLCDDRIVTKPGHVIKSINKTLSVTNIPEDRNRIIPEEIALEILFEDEHLIAVNKKPGLVVHPGVGHHSGTLVHALADYQQKNNLDQLRLLHRLDKDTSGVLLISKSESSYALFMDMFEKRQLEKVYLALIAGTPKTLKGYIDAPIDRATHDRQKFAVSASHTSRQALTAYQVIDFFGKTSLIAVRLHTGRTHQIRVHMHSIGHPIIGDETYHNDHSQEVSFELKAERQMLHAYQISFVHPVTKKPIEIIAPLPYDIRALLGGITNKKYKVPSFSFADYDYHRQW